MIFLFVDQYNYKVKLVLGYDKEFAANFASSQVTFAKIWSTAMVSLNAITNQYEVSQGTTIVAKFPATETSIVYDTNPSP